MAPKNNHKPATNRKHHGIGHTCGECTNGTWSTDHENRDTQGQPFLKICKHSQWTTNARGEHVCLRSTHACENYKGQ